MPRSLGLHSVTFSLVHSKRTCRRPPPSSVSPAPVNTQGTMQGDHWDCLGNPQKPLTTPLRLIRLQMIICEGKYMGFPYLAKQDLFSLTVYTLNRFYNSIFNKLLFSIFIYLNKIRQEKE